MRMISSAKRKRVCKDHRRRAGLGGWRIRLRRGTTVVEVAIVAPILLLLLFGAIDFSRANTIRNTTDNAAYEAARRAIVPGATAGSAIAAGQEILAILSIRNAVVTVDPPTITQSTKHVSVSISVPLSTNLYASSPLLSGCSITKTCTLTREQYSTVVP